MKKVILVPLVVSVALTTTSMYAVAKTQSKTTKATKPKVVNVTVSKTAPFTKVAPIEMNQKVTGTIEKITAEELTLKTKDGKSYWVPTLGFSNLEDYNKLGLKEGMEITLIGFSPKIMAASEVGPGAPNVIVKAEAGISSAIISIDQKDQKLPNKVMVKTIEVSSKEHEGKDMFIPNEITSGGVTVKLTTSMKNVISSAMPVTPTEKITGTVEKITETDMVVKTKDGKLYFVPTLIFSELENFKKLNLKIGIEVSLTGFEAPAAPALPGDSKGDVIISGPFTSKSISKEDIATISSVTLVDGKDLKEDGLKIVTISPKDLEGKIMFMAEEITVGNVTVKLPKDIK